MSFWRRERLTMFKCGRYEWKLSDESSYFSHFRDVLMQFCAMDFSYSPFKFTYSNSTLPIVWCRPGSLHRQRKPNKKFLNIIVQDNICVLWILSRHWSLWYFPHLIDIYLVIYDRRATNFVISIKLTLKKSVLNSTSLYNLKSMSFNKN